MVLFTYCLKRVINPNNKDSFYLQKIMYVVTSQSFQECGKQVPTFYCRTLNFIKCTHYHCIKELNNITAILLKKVICTSNKRLAVD